MRPSPELVERWRREDEEARRIRRECADWSFIEKQPARLRLALVVYVERGDLYEAARVAGLSLDEFNELRLKAKVPRVA